jgi:hypothetical protein
MLQDSGRLSQSARRYANPQLDGVWEDAVKQELPFDQADWQYGGKSSVRERLMSSSGWIGFRRK